MFFGSAKRQNGALWSRFLRLVGYGFGPYPDFSDSFKEEFSEVRSPLVFVEACQRLGDGSALEW